MKKFIETKEKVNVTTRGWDGRQYAGEGSMRKVWILENEPGKKFVRLYQKRHQIYCFHIITDEQRNPGIHEISFYWSE